MGSDEMVMERGPGKLMVSALIFATAFVWATILALVAVGGGLWAAVGLAAVGGIALAWVREHV